ncbi:MAG TPA: hypothetical protein VK571_08715 [Gemmatimonadaceae bacterium]|nr:hypothetical protein [Gemmatimonadaceae bacterium]
MKTLFVRELVNVGERDERYDFTLATSAHLTPHIQDSLIESDGSRPWESLHEIIAAMEQIDPPREDLIQALKALDFRFQEIFDR